MSGSQQKNMSSEEIRSGPPQSKIDRVCVTWNTISSEEIMEMVTETERAAAIGIRKTVFF